MVLVDTSVWVQHLRSGNARLRALLQDGEVAVHPFVVGELACGNLRNRRGILGLLQALPEVPIASQEEVLHLIEARRLYGRGFGWVDAHILASAILAGTWIWTLDRALHRASAKVGIAA